MRSFSAFLVVMALALAQSYPIEGLYGPFKVKEVLPPNILVLETGHRFLLGGVELPDWTREGSLEAQLRRRKLPLSLKHRGQEARLCLGQFLHREVYLELELLPQAPLAYLYLTQLKSHELLLERPTFSFQGQAFDQLNYLWVRSGCAWATGQGKWAALLAEAERWAREDGRGLWRP